MQREQVVRIIRQALEAEDFADTKHSSPVLRALYGIAEKMQELGYSQMAQHIWAEMGKVLGKKLPRDQEPGQGEGKDDP